jgi:hypothetical protein
MQSVHYVVESRYAESDIGGDETNVSNWSWISAVAT